MGDPGRVPANALRSRREPSTPRSRRRKANKLLQQIRDSTYPSVQQILSPGLAMRRGAEPCERKIDCSWRPIWSERFIDLTTGARSWFRAISNKSLTVYGHDEVVESR